ncbi:MAG: aminotransferase class III-fold pyridoxal phosphate-dependent enzyme, partial [Acidimicrobiales bacterium]
VDRLFEAPDGMFSHGATWGGHPVSTTVAIANIHALADEHVLDNVQANAPRLAAGLNELVGRHRVLKEVRGTGYFYALELMADSETGRELTHDQSTSLLRSVLPVAMRKVNLLTRPDDRGATMLVLAPPLIADAAVVDELLGQVDAVLDEAGRFVNG